jgi:hypothetical protein
MRKRKGWMMELDSYVISLDATKCICTIGNIEILANKPVISKTVTFNIEIPTMIYAIKSIGKLARISLENNNKIFKIVPYENNPYKSHEDTIEFSGCVLEKIEPIKKTCVFKFRNSKDLFVRAFVSPNIQNLALAQNLLETPVNFRLLTKTIRYCDQNSKVVSITSYQELGKSTQ